MQMVSVLQRVSLLSRLLFLILCCKFLLGKSLYFSIPYEKGWRAAVDGEDAVIEPALSVLSAVRLDPGRHTVELRYTPPGFCAGLAISLAAVLFLGLWLILIRRQKSK